MKERPILFSGEMVRAIREGRKTVTRRVVKPQPIIVPDVTFEGDFRWQMPDYHKNLWVAGSQISKVLSKDCPYGQTGDRLWVREAWAAVHFVEGHNEGYATGFADEWHGSKDIPPTNGDGYWVPQYRANADWEEHRDDRGFDWRPSIHMPRWASRITLKVTGVRVERVQDITEYECWQEGIGPARGSGETFCDHPKSAFQKLWDPLNAKRGFGWDKNPWVWVIEFKKV